MILLKIENILLEYIFNKILIWKLNKECKVNRYNYFIDNNGIKDWGAKDSNCFKKKLIDSGNFGLLNNHYNELKVIDYYCGYVGNQINDVLRGKASIGDREYLRECIDQLEQTLDKFKVHENIFAIRRMPKKYFKRGLKKGDLVIDKGFMSTSLNLSYRKDYNGNNSYLHNEALVLIKVLKGSKAVFIEEAISKERQRQEFELLLQRNTIFCVEHNFRICSNRVIILNIVNN